MNPEQKFQQLWEYRKKDDEINSSSDDSKSNSGSEPGQKRLRVLSGLVLPKEDEESENTPRSQRSDGLSPLQIVEANSTLHVSGTKKVAAVNRSKGNSMKKRKREWNQTEEPTQLTDLKTFTESLLKEFKVARNAMLVRMKKQITKLMTSKPTSRTRRKEGKNDEAIQQSENGLGLRAQNCNGKPRKSTTPLGSSKRHKATEKRANHEETVVVNGTDKRDNISLPEEKPINDSSSCLTLPSDLSRPKTESLRTEFSSSDHSPAGCSMNRTNTLEKPSFLTDEQSHHGYLLSVLPDEQFGSFSQMSSKSVGFFDQQSNQTSSVHPGLHVPVNQWPNNCFSMTSQIVLETPGQENSSVGLRMNAGGIRFPGRRYAL